VFVEKLRGENQKVIYIGTVIGFSCLILVLHDTGLSIAGPQQLMIS
jgi:hypothetical protein